MKNIFLAAVLMCSSSLIRAAGELIVNEFNAVGSENYLNADPYTASISLDGWLADPNLWGGGICGLLSGGRITGDVFEDANTSYFGILNRWGTLENTQSCAALRAWYQPPTDCTAAIVLGFKNPYDFNNDCYVFLVDFLKFTQKWLTCMNPADTGYEITWLQ